MYLEVPQEQQARLTLEDVVVVRARLLTCSFLGWWSYMTTSIHFDPLRSTSIHYDPLRSTTIHYDSLRFTTIHYDSLLTLLFHVGQVENKVSTVTDFMWLSQMRYYWQDNETDKSDLWVQMVAARRPYGYEYLGNSFRLVITPLTDKCYLTLMGALEMILG
jgi:hypothetical protein